MISLLLAVPFLFSVSPSSAPAGAPGLTVTVSGRGFSPNCVGRWNGRDRATAFITTNQLRVHLRPSDLIAEDAGVVSVYDRLSDASSTAARFEVVGGPPAGQARLFLLAPPLAVPQQPPAEPASVSRETPRDLEPRRIPGKTRL